MIKEKWMEEYQDDLDDAFSETAPDEYPTKADFIEEQWDLRNEQ